MANEAGQKTWRFLAIPAGVFTPPPFNDYFPSLKIETVATISLVLK